MACSGRATQVIFIYLKKRPIQQRNKRERCRCVTPDQMASTLNELLLELSILFILSQPSVPVETTAQVSL